MRLAVLFLFIATFAFGEILWEPNQEYVYGIYTRTLTALPDLKEQYVGVITKGKLVVQVVSPNRIVGKLVDCVYANFHDILENGIDTEIPETVLNFQPSELNNKPFVCEVKNGLINSILVDQTWTNDQTNQLKGILSQLQIDIQGTNLIQIKKNHLPQVEGRPQGVYTVMEPTVTGMCETIYDVQPIQEFQLGQILPSWTYFKNVEQYPYKWQIPEQKWPQQQQPWQEQQQSWQEQKQQQPWQEQKQQQPWQQGQTQQPWQQEQIQEPWQQEQQQQPWQEQKQRQPWQQEQIQQPWQQGQQQQPWQEGQQQQKLWQQKQQYGSVESGEQMGELRKTKQEQFTKSGSIWEHLPSQEVQQKQPWGYWPQTQFQGHFFEIVKTINYNNCMRHKGYHFGIKGRENLMPFGNKVGDILSRSTVTKIICYGTWNNFIVQDIITNDRVSVSPHLYQEQKAQVVSQVQLKLLEKNLVKTKLQEPQQTIDVGNLIYTYNLSSDKMNQIRPQNIQVQSEIPETWKTETDHERFTSEEQEVPFSEELQGRPMENLQYLRGQRKLNMQVAPEIPLYYYNVGNKGRGIQIDPKINIENECWKLVNEIAQDVLVQDEIPKRNTLEKFDILCDLIRVMNQQQILNVYRQLGGQTEVVQNLINLIQKKVFRDAVAHAGTGPAVSVVCKWIITLQVKGIEARDLIEDTCKNLQTPTTEIIRTIFDLVKNDEVRKHKQLYSQVLLCLSNLLRHAQVNRITEHNRFPVYVFGTFHKELEQVVVNEIIPYLTRCLQESTSASNDQYTLLYLRALGNIAHPEILNVYEECLKSGVKLTQFQRTALVLSLDKLAKVHPNLVRRILFKIYANVAEAPETRSVAVLLLLRCNPSVQMLQRLAESTHDDPSESVRSIVKSAITTCSQLKGKKWENLSDKCKSVRKFLTQHVFGDLYSKTYLRDYVAKEMNLIYHHQLTHILGEDNIIPKITHFEAFESLGGFNTRVAGMQAMVSTVEELVKLLPNCKKGFCQKPTTYYPHPEQTTTYPKSIKDQLNIIPETAKRLEGQLLFDFMGRKGFYTFDEKMLRELPQTLVSTFGLFKEGENLNYNKLYLRQQVVIAFPLATGYPFIYTFKQPQLLQAIGQVQIKTTPDLAQMPTLETIQNLETITINANVHLVYSTNLIGKTGFITPFNRQRYVAGLVRKVHTHIPLSLRLEINLRDRSINLKVTPIDTKKDFYLLQSGAWPFTLRKDVFDLRPAAEATDLKVIQTRKSQVFEQVLGEKTTGMAFQLQCEHQIKGEHHVDFEKALWRQGMISLLNVPLSYHDLFQKVLQNEGQSLLSFLPFAFQPRMNGNFLNHVISNLLSLPFADELNINDYLKDEGLATFLTLPFADKHTLEESLKSESILKLGGWPWPLKSLDYYKYNLKFDAVRSVNQIIKLSLKFDAVHDLNKTLQFVSNRVQGPATMDEQKLAYATVTTPDNEQRRMQFLQNAAQGIKQASVAVLDAAVVFDGQNKAEYVVTIAHGESPVDEKDRLLIFFNTNKVKKSENRQMCISYVGKFPLTPMLNFEKALQHDLTSNIRVQVAYGDNCQTTKTNVLLNINLEQSPEFKQMVKYSNVGQRCLREMREGNKQLGGCIDATYQANLLDTITFNLDLQNPTPKINDCIHGFLNMIRKVAAWNLQHEAVNPKVDLNKIVAVLKLKPIMNNEDKKYTHDTIGIDNVDMMINSGDVIQVFTNVPVNRILRPILSVHPTLTAVDRLIRNSVKNGHICSIDQNKIMTFDNNIVKHQIGKCWHAMLVHTKLRSRLGKLAWNNEIVQQKDVSILVRQATNVNEKELMIVCKTLSGVEHRVHLIPTGSAIQVKVDGQMQTVTPNQCYNVWDEQQDKTRQRPLISVRKLLGNEVKVVIRGKQMKVFFDGISVRVHTDPAIYRKNLQGLCGAYTGEKTRDLITPGQCVLTNHKLFTSSWVVDTTTCSPDVQQAKLQVNQMKCNRVQYTTANILRNWNIKQKTTPWTTGWPYTTQQKTTPEYQQTQFGEPQTHQWGVKQTEQQHEMSGEQRWGEQKLGSWEQQEVQQQYGKSKVQEMIGEKRVGSWEQLGQQEHKWSEEQFQPQAFVDTFQKGACVMKNNIRYFEEEGKICFSKSKINMCPTQCIGMQKKELNIDVYCREKDDPVTKMWIQQIQMGETPDLSSKEITKTMKINVPSICVH